MQLTTKSLVFLMYTKKPKQMEGLISSILVKYYTRLTFSVTSIHLFQEGVGCVNEVEALLC